MMRWHIAFYLICWLYHPGDGQTICLDGHFEDWSDSEYWSDIGDHTIYPGLDGLFLSNDSRYLYLSIELSDPALLQDNNNILLGVDFDNNADTGLEHGDIGAELVFNFGLRNGFLFHQGAIFQIEHADAGLLAAPTVSSDRFEIAIPRAFTRFGIDFRMGDEIAVHLSSGGPSGDQLPNTGRLVFSLENDVPFTPKTYTLSRPSASEFRIVSFNAARDKVFDSPAREIFGVVMSHFDADIFCFQEIYDHSASDMVELMQEQGIIQGSGWTAIKHNPDLITVTRYPVIYENEVGSNSVVVLDAGVSELLIINAHLPCCDNDRGREIEIDQILQFIRRSAEGLSGYELSENTPYLICGDMNLVGDAAQLNSLLTGDIRDNAFFGPDVSLDWDNNGMEDLLPVTTGFPAHFTWYSEGSSFFPGRLDLLLYTDAVLKAHNGFAFYSAGLAIDERQELGLGVFDSQRMSDHLPIIADFSFEPIVGLNVFLNNDIHVFPNPSDGRIHIEKFHDIDEILIFDLAGNKVLQVVNPGRSVDYDLPSGTYLVHLKTRKGEVLTNKLIVH